MIMIIICNQIAPAVQLPPLVKQSNLIALSYRPACLPPLRDDPPAIAVRGARTCCPLRASNAE